MSNCPEIIQIKVRLLGISPMVWRRLQIPSEMTLQRLHGVIQVAMGWDGIHLYQFDVRAVIYGSPELSVFNPDVAIREFGFREKDRFSYAYDMGDYWHHEVRVEKTFNADSKTTYPVCIGGSGVCPPEDCGGVEEFLRQRDEANGYDAWRDLDILTGFAQELLDCHDAGLSLADLELSELQAAVERVKAREVFTGERFSKKQANTRLRDGDHMKLMHQQQI